jgi:outer membrane protein
MKRAAAFLLLVLAAAASTGAETHRFTLEQAIAYGLANSTSIRTKELAVAAAQADLAAARSAYYPSLSAGLSYMHQFEQPAADYPAPLGRVYLAASDPVGLSVDLSQTVYSFGKIDAGVRLSEKAMAQAAADLAEEKRKTAVVIERAFYAYLLAVAVQAINRETLDHRQESLGVARARYAAGLVADFEVLRAESDLESFRATVISSDNGVRVALLNVKNVLGIEEEEFSFELVGSLAPIEAPIERDRLVARALEGRYDLQSLRNNLSLLKAQETLSRTMNRPTLVGWANYQLSSGFDDTTGRNEYFGAGAWDGNLTAGLSLNVPISVFFPWSKETAGIRKGGLQVESLGLQLQSAESAVRLAVDSTILKIAEEQAKIASGKKAVELAERLYDSAQKQYEGGYISSIDLKDAELGLSAARLAHARAIFGHNQNILDLMDVVGVANF